MSELKVNSEDIEMVFQRLRALPGNKVSTYLYINILFLFSINNKINNLQIYVLYNFNQ